MSSDSARHLTQKQLVIAGVSLALAGVALGTGYAFYNEVQTRDELEAVSATLARAINDPPQGERWTAGKLTIGFEKGHALLRATWNDAPQRAECERSVIDTHALAVAVEVNMNPVKELGGKLNLSALRDLCSLRPVKIVYLLPALTR